MLPDPVSCCMPRQVSPERLAEEESEATAKAQKGTDGQTIAPPGGLNLDAMAHKLVDNSLTMRGRQNKSSPITKPTAMVRCTASASPSEKTLS